MTARRGPSSSVPALLFLVLLLFAAPARAACDTAECRRAAELGEMYFSGGKDYPSAKRWFLKAAREGDGASQLRLGFLYAEAHFAGLTTDYAEAERWFTKAAEQDAGDARFRLGNFYANYKKPRDYARAYLWLKRASEGGHRTAMFDLANLYRQGKGAPRNNAAALSWMTKAAEAGVTQAMLALSEMYAAGDGVPKNPALAAKWTLRTAADPAASVFALNRAGDLLFDGRGGMPRNYPAARGYYERAALKGDAHARGRLAKMYGEGLGVRKDLGKAGEYGAAKP